MSPFEKYINEEFVDEETTQDHSEKVSEILEKFKDLHDTFYSFYLEFVNGPSSRKRDIIVELRDGLDKIGSSLENMKSEFPIEEEIPEEEV